MDPLSSKESFRFLSFANNEEDAEKSAKLREAAAKIEQAIEKEKSLSELVDYNGPTLEEQIDLANDTRSLYERLQEQRNKKKEAFEESQKLSNLVSTLDEDDANYLNEVIRKKHDDEVKKRLEVYDALEAKKRRDEQKRLEAEKNSDQPLTSNKSSSIKSKLSSMIKVKPKVKRYLSTASDQDDQNEPVDGAGSSRNRSREQDDHGACNPVDSSGRSTCNQAEESNKRIKIDKERKNSDSDNNDPPSNISCNETDLSNQVVKCIGVLPALPLASRVHDSSASDDSSDIDGFDQRFILKGYRRRRR